LKNNGKKYIKQLNRDPLDLTGEELEEKKEENRTLMIYYSKILIIISAIFNKEIVKNIGKEEYNTYEEYYNYIRQTTIKELGITDTDKKNKIDNAMLDWDSFMTDLFMYWTGIDSYSTNNEAKYNIELKYIKYEKENTEKNEKIEKSVLVQAQTCAYTLKIPYLCTKQTKQTEDINQLDPDLYIKIYKVLLKTLFTHLISTNKFQME